MVIAPPPGLPYHRLARTARHAWWRPVLGLLLIAASWITAAVLLYAFMAAAAALAGRPAGPGGESGLGELADLAAGFAVIALLLPLTLAAARWVQRRPAGSLSSVLGRLRWRWLLLCLLPAGGALTVTLGVSAVLPAGAAGGAWAGWGPLLAGTAVLLLVVPVQAAAEEYAFRGYLLQAAGSFLRRPWAPILLQAVLFAALHGWGTPWGFADLVVFGALAGYLTVRTGGVEAAVALHVVNNVAATVLAVALGQLTLDESAADMPWQMAAVDVPVLVAYTLVVLRLAGRRRIAALSPAGPDQPALVGEGHRLHPVAQVQLGEHARQVRLDGRFAQEQFGGDLGVGQPPRHQPQHVGLALGQRGEPGGPGRVGGRRVGQ
jgi:membrane protease YdiL (CAAX protease family)